MGAKTAENRMLPPQSGASSRPGYVVFQHLILIEAGFHRARPEAEVALITWPIWQQRGSLSTMPTDYEKVYCGAKRALGEPTKEFVTFFETLARSRLRVIDVGCGQGRDALFIARLGHSVVGIDQSPTGISDLLADAEAEGLHVQGFVSDIRSFEPAGMYDVLLIDRTLHMLDASERPAVLARYLDRVEAGGYVLIADERSNIPMFEAVLEADRRNWQLVKRRRGYLFAREASLPLRDESSP